MNKSEFILGMSESQINMYRGLNQVLNTYVDINESKITKHDEITNLLIDSNEASLKAFFAWAKNVVSRLVLSDDQAKRDPNVSPKEAPSLLVKDREDMIARLAKMLAGLQYYASKNDAETNRVVRNLDKDVEDNIKHRGSESDIKNLIKDLRDSTSRSKVSKLIDQLQNYYLKVV